MCRLSNVGSKKSLTNSANRGFERNGVDIYEVRNRRLTKRR